MSVNAEIQKTGKNIFSARENFAYLRAVLKTPITNTRSAFWGIAASVLAATRISSGSLVLLALAATARAQVYTSPFAISGISAMPTWGDELSTREGLINTYSTPSPAQWYSSNYTAGSWGPLMPQLFSSASSPNLLHGDRGQGVFNAAPLSPNPGLDPLTASRQRLVYTAASFIGTHYQHFHLPDFNPANVTQPGGYPWIAVSDNNDLQTTQQLGTGNRTTIPNPYKATYSSPQPGIDCTDFSAMVYNLALGIQMHSGVTNQVSFPNVTANTTATAQVLDDSGNTMDPNFLYSPNFGTTTPNAPGSLNDILGQLEPGDLLYMQGDLQITHVVMWLGEYGTTANGSASAVPLIISSHDNTPAIFDVNGTDQIDLTTGLPLAMLPDGSNATDFLPPPGVQILPFTPDTWFYQNFSLAMQVVPEPSALLLLLAAGPILFAFAHRRKKLPPR